MSAECTTENIPPGYKQTEVGVIPEDWEVRPAGEICKVNQGLQIAISKRLKIQSPNSKKYITIQYLNEGKETEYIDSYSQSVCCNQNDILMTRTGNTGVVITNVEGVFHNNFFKINYSKKLITKEHLVNFLRLEQTQRQIIIKAGTSTIPDLNHNDFYSIYIIIPPLAEQETIAKALSDADALIESLEQLIAKKRQIKQGAMQELLTGKRRLPGFGEGKGYKQTEFGVIPADWKVTKLIELANVIDSLHQTPSFNENGFPMVRVSDIKPGNLDLSRTLKVCETVFTEFTKNYKPKRCDIVLSRVGSYGVSSFVETDEPFCMGQNTVVIEPQVPARLLYYILNSPYIRQQIEDKSFGTGYKSLSLKSIKELKISLPHTLAERTAIANILSDMDSEITTLEEKLAKAHQIKQGMMQELLTGRIRLA